MAERILALFDINRCDDSANRTRVHLEVERAATHIRRWRPDLMVGIGAKRFQSHYFGPHNEMPWAGFIISTDALVIADGLTIVDDRLIVGRSLMDPVEVFPSAHPMPFTNIDGHWHASIPDEVQHFSGTTANLACDGWRTYGHWLVDVLPRLMRVISSEFKVDQYLFPGPAVWWMTALLEAMHIDMSKCRFVDLRETTIICDRVIQPTYSRFNSEVSPDIVDAAIRIRTNICADIIPSRRLYIQRNGHARPLENRSQMEDVISSRGFETVAPEAVSIPDQVRMFAEATHIIGECGSGMHNSIFSHVGTKVGIIQDWENFNFLQAQLAMASEQDIFYAVGERRLGVDGQVATCDVEAVGEIADAMLGRW